MRARTLKFKPCRAQVCHVSGMRWRRLCDGGPFIRRRNATQVLGHCFCVGPDLLVSVGVAISARSALRGRDSGSTSALQAEIRCACGPPLTPNLESRGHSVNTHPL